jgi:hypothetical protein
MKMKISNYVFALLMMACTFNSFAKNAPQLTHMDYDDLVVIQSEIQKNNPTFLPAYQSLLKEANASLKVTPEKIIDGDVPPTGDLHDFFTIGKYSWPNPNTPDSLPYIRKDCQINKEAFTDRYDLDRYSRTIKHVSTLSLAWFYSKEDKYAVKAAEMLRIWFLNPETKMNPNFNCAAALPGVSNGEAIGIIFAGAMIKMLDHVKLLALSSAWTKDDDKALKQWFSQLTDWLLESKFGQKEAKANNNHGSWYAAQVSGFALYAGDLHKVKPMMELAKRQIGLQIDADGSLPAELRRPDSFGYSNYGLQAFTVLASISRHVNEDLWNYKAENGRDLKLAWSFLAPYIGGKGGWIRPNIKEVKLSPGSVGWVRRAAKAYRDPELIRIYKLLLEKSSAKARGAWLEGILTD